VPTSVLLLPMNAPLPMCRLVLGFPIIVTVMVPAPMLVFVADDRIADVGQVVRLRTLAEGGVLQLDEVPTWASSPILVPGRTCAKGPSTAPFAITASVITV